MSDDEGRRASPEVGWGYAGRRIVSTVGSRALQDKSTPRAGDGTAAASSGANDAKYCCAGKTMGGCEDRRAADRLAMGKDLGCVGASRTQAAGRKGARPASLTASALLVAGQPPLTLADPACQGSMRILPGSPPLSGSVAVLLAHGHRVP